MKPKNKLPVIRNCKRCGGNGELVTTLSGGHYVECSACRETPFHQEGNARRAIKFWNEYYGKDRKRKAGRIENG